MRQTLSKTMHGVLAQAEQEARSLNQEFVGTEHLLLGMLASSECEVAKMLHAHHVSVDRLVAFVRRSMPKGQEPPAVVGKLPLSPRSQRVVNNALVKAAALQQDRVTTRLLLWALLEEPQTLLHDAMRQAGGDLDMLVRKLQEKPEFEEE